MAKVAKQPAKTVVLKKELKVLGKQWLGMTDIQRANHVRRLLDIQPTIFVVGHERNKLKSIGDAPHIHKVFLPSLKQNMRLAENQIYLSDLLLKCHSEYIGLASASWNIKYDGKTEWHGRHWPHCLPIEQLNTLEFSPNVVWSAARTDNTSWSEALDYIFNGIHPLINEIIEHFGLRHHYRVGPLANNYVAHRSVVHALTRFMRATMGYLFQRYGSEWPLKPDRLAKFADRLPAFMGEALSILFFVQQVDLEIRQIPAP